MPFIPPSVLRWTATAVAFALGAIVYVLQDCAAFVVEGALQVARTHGLCSLEMLTHFRAQACFACVCFVAGSLSWTLLWWLLCRLCCFAAWPVRLAATVVYRTVVFWVRPFAPLARALLCVLRCVSRCLPEL